MSEKIVQNFSCPFIFSKLTKIYRVQLRKKCFSRRRKKFKNKILPGMICESQMSRSSENSSRKTNKFRFFFRSDEGEIVWRLPSDFNSKRFSTKKALSCFFIRRRSAQKEKAVIKRWKQRSRAHGWVEVF